MTQSGKPAPKRPAPRRGDNPRQVALTALQDVTRAGAYASLALNRRLRESDMPQRDKNLVSELVYGTLEKLLTLDYCIDRRLERTDIELLVRNILRLGAYQILYMRTPDHAAVDESVTLARRLGRESFAGLVNAILRSLSREKDALSWPERQADPARYLSVRYSLPQWIVLRLLDAYGEEMAEQIAAWTPQAHTLTVRRTPGRLSREAFEGLMTAKGWRWEPGRLEGAYYVANARDVGLDKDYLQGVFSVQGESSMLAAMAVSPRRGANVLDACAAPGGKTACLSEAMGGTGRVYAWDVHEHRVDLIRGMVRRLRLDNVRPAVRDALHVKEDLLGVMDAVLLDAPCSGLGVMLSKPDVKYRQSPESVASLVQTQRALLDACCGYARPGGTLVYSTCTILPEENRLQAEAFLARHGEFSLDPEGLRAALPPEFAARADSGMLQLLAHRDGLEGFFIARMRRRT